MTSTVILYHAQCPDGFGAAFAAWKKFGKEATYIPVFHDKPIPEGLEGKEVYIADFSYPNGTLVELEKKVQRLVVLDHHLGARAEVEAVREHVFDEKRSGAGIAWDYFHPSIARPHLINYVEDGDLYTFTLPHAREVLAYVYTRPFTFESWEHIRTELEDETRRRAIIAHGASYQEHWNLLIEKIMNQAVLVNFEGYTVYLASAPDMFASDTANRLARKKGPFALAVKATVDGTSVSLRSDGSVNVANIAKKFGGGGHPGAAGFRIPYDSPVPWQSLQE